MTLLERISVGHASISVFEAAYHQGNADTRRQWRWEAIPYFDDLAHKYWQLYGACSAVTLSEDEEADERRRFQMHPIIVLHHDHNVVGGSWIDVVHRGPVATFHFGVMAGYRQYAKDLLAVAEQRMDKFVSIRCVWGRRQPENDPSAFFARHGYRISPFFCGGIATKAGRRGYAAPYRAAGVSDSRGQAAARV